MPRIRDSQRAKVYKAERVLAPLGERVETVPDIERFVAYVWSLKRVQDAWPRAVRQWKPPAVHDGGGRVNAAANSFKIFMPRWSRTTNVIIHELSHTITKRTLDEAAGHGWQFCQNYLRLVLYVMGREAHDALRESFKKNRVRFKEPKPRKPVSEERRARLAQILATARAKKNTMVTNVVSDNNLSD